MTASASPPLVMHVIYRLAMGGLENGLVNLINHMPSGRYRHVVVCLTDFTDFRERICSSGGAVLALHKQPGMDWSVYGKLWAIIRDMKPTIMHTRNLPTLEMAAVAALARVPYRIHGEHGRDLHDAYGASKKFLIFRKILDIAVHHYVAVSRDLEQWLQNMVTIAPRKVSQIYNGVDTEIFYSNTQKGREVLPDGFASGDQVVIGTVGRLEHVKDQATLIRGLASLVKMDPAIVDKVRVVIVGDGSLKTELELLVRDSHLTDMVWMAGARTDIPRLLQSMDIFMLPSEAEGISNTILEAMATGLPVIATRVGGNAELVLEGETGLLVPPKDPQALGLALSAYLQDRGLMRSHGVAGRKRVEKEFSMRAMVERYLQVYDGLVGKS
ncbi:MAG: TIGR03088 family PEP-CTERM/XrtA system glycosyltransferase [Nitrospira sp.]|nr:TIGR03088 family PEP-CTERM/XrtA system glycosyltransferase [Nitrospira sp.]